MLAFDARLVTAMRGSGLSTPAADELLRAHHEERGLVAQAILSFRIPPARRCSASALPPAPGGGVTHRTDRSQCLASLSRPLREAAGTQNLERQQPGIVVSQRVGCSQRLRGGGRSGAVSVQLALQMCNRTEQLRFGAGRWAAPATGRSLHATSTRYVLLLHRVPDQEPALGDEGHQGRVGRDDDVDTPGSCRP